jgi:ABC-2 type transport system permease protein
LLASGGDGVRKAFAVGRKEFHQIVRDRRSLAILLLFPAFVLLLFGYALNWDVRHIKLAVDDRDRSADSRALISAFVNSGYFDLVAIVDSDAELTRLMDRNDARAVLVIPPAFEEDLQRQMPVPVQLLLNGDNANTATTVMGYALTIVQSEVARRQRGGPSGRPPISVETRIWYNPQLRSTLFLVPGLIAYISMLSAVVSTALSIVREKERGTVEQVRMAPLGPFAFVVGKTIPYFVLALLSAMGIVFVAMVLFGLPMRGSWLLLLAAVALFLIGALGLGLLISSVAETLQVAFQLALLASFLPTLMLSGFIFPIASMPQVLQAITRVVPARYFLTALRGILLKGVGMDVVWPDLAALAVYSGVVLGLASIRLHRQWS